jgi:hypothetical protein
MDTIKWSETKGTLSVPSICKVPFLHKVEESKGKRMHGQKRGETGQSTVKMLNGSPHCAMQKWEREFKSFLSFLNIASPIK